MPHSLLGRPSLNAARVYRVDVEQLRRAQAFDPVARAREEYRNAPDPSFVSHGPRTLEELAAVQRAEGHR